MSEKEECKKCQELEKFLADANEEIIKISEQRDENHSALIILTKKVSISDANAEYWHKCTIEDMDKCRDLENELHGIRVGAIESAKIKELESTIVKMATSAFGGGK